MDLFCRMGDVQVAFGILTHCFVQWPSYLLRCTPPFSTFIKYFTSFYSSFFQVFGCFLGPWSFDNPKGLLTHKQGILLITFGGIGFIPTATIGPTTYLRNWALVASIIVIRFIVDQHPFLFEALAWVDNNTFPFQQHFKVACGLLLAAICTCFLSFEQLIGQQMVQLQDSISKHLHHHTLSSILSNGIFKTYCVRILSCYGPWACV